MFLIEEEMFLFLDLSCAHDNCHLNVGPGQNNFLMADHFSHMLDALNNESTSDNKSKHLSNGNGEQGR